MNYAPDNALRVLKNSQALVILYRHVAARATEQLHIVANLQRPSAVKSLQTLQSPAQEGSRESLSRTALVYAAAVQTNRYFDFCTRLPNPRNGHSLSNHQNCGFTRFDHVCLTRFGISRGNDIDSADQQCCSRQSSRDNRTVDSLRSPDDFQSANETSNGVRGLAVVTAATTTSARSNHSTNTGRFFEEVVLVKGISATQNSPG